MSLICFYSCFFCFLSQTQRRLLPQCKHPTPRVISCEYNNGHSCGLICHVKHVLLYPSRRPLADLGFVGGLRALVKCRKSLTTYSSPHGHLRRLLQTTAVSGWRNSFTVLLLIDVSHEPLQFELLSSLATSCQNLDWRRIIRPRRWVAGQFFDERLIFPGAISAVMFRQFDDYLIHLPRAVNWTVVALGKVRSNSTVSLSRVPRVH